MKAYEAWPMKKELVTFLRLLKLLKLKKNSVITLQLLTLFKMGGAKRTIFFSVIFTNVGIRPQNFLTCSFITPLPHWCKISCSHLVPIQNYWTWTKTTHQKKQIFWSNPHKIEVMITFLTEMLELPNFGHTAASTIWFKSCDKNLVVTSWT